MSIDDIKYKAPFYNVIKCKGQNYPFKKKMRDDFKLSSDIKFYNALYPHNLSTNAGMVKSNGY